MSPADDRAPAPRIHGGLPRGELRALGIAAEAVVDFSVSCNPYGPCAALVDAIRGAPIERYPDPAATEAREALAARLGTTADRIALGNGAAELLWTLAQLLVRRGEPVVVVEPAFGEWRAAAEHAGGRICEWRARPADGFAVELAEVGRAIEATGARLAYLCTPGTPSGGAVPVHGVRALAEAHPQVTIVVDQSFLALSERFADAAEPLPPNAVCVRSLTKDHAIPGVRIGYAIAEPALVARIDAGRASWTTGAAAQAAAIAACGAAAVAFVADSRRRLLDDRAGLAAMLGGLGLAPAPSSTGFVVVRTGGARALRDRLLARHHLLVRDCTSFGLPDHIRLAARSAGDRARLAAALRTELSR
jgi:histidinol-phosphate/aromatic aminotransferase/cobyric acid decarboxylase-like protein